jgi:hypothetical protein
MDKANRHYDPTARSIAPAEIVGAQKRVSEAIARCCGTNPPRVKWLTGKSGKKSSRVAGVGTETFLPTAELIRQPDGSLSQPTRPERDTYTITAGVGPRLSAIRLEMIADALPKRGPGRCRTRQFAPE